MGAAEQIVGPLVVSATVHLAIACAFLFTRVGNALCGLPQFDFGPRVEENPA
jgi:hypothetical protein